VRVHPGLLNWQALTLIAVLAMVAATSASARGVRVEQGSDGFATSGQAWEVTAFTASDTPRAVNLQDFPIFPDVIGPPPVDFPDDGGFFIDYGDGPVSELNILANGQISFGGTAVVAPFQLKDGVVPSDMAFALGLLDLGGGPDYSVDNAVQAFRMTWTVENTEALEFFPFQVVLLDMSGLPGGEAGDFDMEFNYGFDGQSPPLNLLATAGFVLDGNILNPFGGPFTAEQNYTWSFRGGLCTNCVLAVPEPDALVLIGAGLVVVGIGRRRRRVAVQPAR
jgi:hypothetical protein